MRKRLMSITSIVLLIVLCLTVVCNASYLRMDNVRQEKSNWCWAACSQMVGTWKWGNKTQTDIVRYMFGSSVPNTMASASQTATAATYASNNNATWSVKSDSLFLSEVRTQINSRSNPVIACCKYSSASGGHMLVVKGVNSNNAILVSDPGTGSSEWVDCDTFTNSYNGRYWHQTILIN